jgi:hypothetical protein
MSVDQKRLVANMAANNLSQAKEQKFGRMPRQLVHCYGEQNFDLTRA